MIAWRSAQPTCSPFFCDFELHRGCLSVLQSSLFNRCSLWGTKLLPQPMSQVLQEMVMSYPRGHLRPWHSGHVEFHVAPMVVLEKCWSCPYPQSSATGQSWKEVALAPATASALLCTDGVPCSGPAQSHLLCKGRCRWRCRRAHLVVALQSSEPESQPAPMWWILGNSLTTCASQRQWQSVHSLWSKCFFFLAQTCSSFRKNPFARGQVRAEQELSEDISLL